MSYSERTILWQEIIRKDTSTIAVFDALTSETGGRRLSDIPLEKGALIEIVVRTPCKED